MATSLTSKGQVTIPKHIRDTMQLESGCEIEFQVNDQGEIVLHKVEPAARRTRKKDRFEAVRGKADIKWQTHELMALLRGED